MVKFIFSIFILSAFSVFADEAVKPVAERVLDRVTSYHQVMPCSQFKATELQNPEVLRVLRRGMDAGVLPRPLFSNAEKYRNSCENLSPPDSKKLSQMEASKIAAVPYREMYVKIVNQTEGLFNEYVDIQAKTAELYLKCAKQDEAKGSQNLTPAAEKFCQEDYKDIFLPEMNNRLKTLRVALYKWQIQSHEVDPGKYDKPLKPDWSLVSDYLPSTLKDRPKTLPPLTKSEIEIFEQRNEKFPYNEQLLENAPKVVFFFALNSSPLLSHLQDAELTSKNIQALLEKFLKEKEAKPPFSNIDFQNRLAFVNDVIGGLKSKDEQLTACRVAEFYLTEMRSEIRQFQLVSTGLAFGGAYLLRNKEAAGIIKPLLDYSLKLGTLLTGYNAVNFKFSHDQLSALSRSCNGKMYDEEFRAQIPTLCDFEIMNESAKQEGSAILGLATSTVAGGIQAYRVLKNGLELGKALKSGAISTAP